MTYNNKNPDLHRTSTKNYTRGNQNFIPSSINYSKDDKQEALENTILGTVRLVRMREEGKLNISEEDINEGIKINAERLEISLDDYNEKLNMVLNPQSEANSEIATEEKEPTA